MSNEKKRPGAFRRILGDLLILLTVLFTVYLCFVMLRRIESVVLKDTYVEVFRYELIICAVLILCALDLRFGLFTLPHSLLLRIIGWALRIVVIAGTLAVLFFAGKVVSGSLVNTASEAKNVLVLGMALEKGKPNADLMYRLDTARMYLDAHPDAALILTGGNADEEGRTEAAVMRELLTEKGVPADKLILEDKAEDTRENFLNTARMIPPAEPVVLISSSYHMERAVRVAGEAGFTDIRRLPAPSDPIMYPANVLWEIIMEVNDLKNASK